MSCREMAVSYRWVCRRKRSYNDCNIEREATQPNKYWTFQELREANGACVIYVLLTECCHRRSKSRKSHVFFTARYDSVLELKTFVQGILVAEAAVFTMQDAETVLNQARVQHGNSG